ncbi:hypothetical protein DFP73DRAFT_562481 [Morchella snyderi]|nr:hypothetical protein DFP73DRAFT_562481 [Morchella snyderi]
MLPSTVMFAVAVACIAALTHASAIPAEDIALTPRDTSPIGNELEKRQCAPGCTCRVGTAQGQYCGACYAVSSCTDSQSACWTNVYECNPQGGCCSYGHRDTCPGSPCG